MTNKKNVPLKRRRRRRSSINWKAVAALVAILVAIVVLVGLIVSTISKNSGSKKTTSNNTDETVSETVTEEETTTETPAIKIDIMMIGDMLMHSGAIKSGLADDGTYNYDHLYTNILTDIKAADVSIVNQETIFAGPDYPYSGYPCFNTPDALGDAEVKAGFNVVLHATNHTLDVRQDTGVEHTLNFWKTNHPEMAVLGINESAEAQNNIYVYNKDGFKVAFLNYTYGTNGIPIPQSTPYIVNMLDKDKITADVNKAKTLADMVVVCPHWGTEYVYQPDNDQKYWTQLFLSLGVDVVLGTHPHVLEPVEVLTNETTGKEMLVYYSLGNFVSNQDEKPRMVGGMANVTLIKDKTGCYVKEYSLTPVVTHKLFGYKLITTYKIGDYTEELASANAIRSDAGCYDFSLSYCQNLAKMILGDEYSIENNKLSVSLHPNGLTKTEATSTAAESTTAK